MKISEFYKTQGVLRENQNKIEHGEVLHVNKEDETVIIKWWVEKEPTTHQSTELDEIFEDLPF